VQGTRLRRLRPGGERCGLTVCATSAERGEGGKRRQRANERSVEHYVPPVARRPTMVESRVRLASLEFG
jgi:hypothetical protein